MTSAALDGLGPTPALSAWLAGVTRESLPCTILDRSRYLLLDGIACAFVGAHLPSARRAVEGTLRIDNGTGASLWGWGRSVSPSAAALLNGTFVQGFELDDFHPHGALHSSSVVATAALAAAEQRGGARFDEFLTALAVGYETGPRVGIAMGGAKATTRGWHTGAVFGPLAAAAAAGKIYGLDASGFESALGNAGTRAGGLMSAQYGAMTKRIHHGMAAQAGLHGAALAAAGFVGIGQVVEQPYGGMISTMMGSDSETSDPQALSRGLGQDWTMMDIGIKRHACLIMLHSTIDALVAERHSIDVSAVERITIGVSQSVAKRTDWILEKPGSALGAQMNMRFAAAVALLDGAAHVDQFTMSSLARPEVWELMDRIDVVRSDEIDALGVSRRFLTSIDVRFRDRPALSLRSTPPQDVPFRDADVIDKFHSLTADLLDDDRRRAITDFVLDADSGEDVRELAALLIGAVPAMRGLAEEEDHADA